MITIGLNDRMITIGSTAINCRFPYPLLTKVRHRILSEVSVSVSDPNPITKDTIRIRKVSYKKIKITIRIRKYPQTLREIQGQGQAIV
jgi:hypothetical protein